MNVIWVKIHYRSKRITEKYWYIEDRIHFEGRIDAFRRDRRGPHGDYKDAKWEKMRYRVSTFGGCDMDEPFELKNYLYFHPVSKQHEVQIYPDYDAFMEEHFVGML